MAVSSIACAIGLAGKAQPMKRKLKWLAIVLLPNAPGFGATVDGIRFRSQPTRADRSCDQILQHRV